MPCASYIIGFFAMLLMLGNGYMLNSLRHLGRAAVLFLLFACLIDGWGTSHAQTRETPYWASISASKARMRVGPTTNYPASWIYQRIGLPVKVVKVHNNWRELEDPDGTRGWMHVRLLSATETAIVTADEANMYRERNAQSLHLYRVQKGVVGQVSDCGEGWCMFDVNGKRGFVRVEAIWGANP